jgi:LPS-assembly lipoprotein
MNTPTNTRRAFLLTLPALTLAGCGFRLRGINAMPFASAWVEAASNSRVADELRQQIESQNRLAATPDKAERILLLTEERVEKHILSLSGAGRVNEYCLRLLLTAQVRDAMGRSIAGPIKLQAQRDFSFSDAQALAKQNEEAMLMRDMALELTRQIIVLASRQ